MLGVNRDVLFSGSWEALQIFLVFGIDATFPFAIMSIIGPAHIVYYQFLLRT